MNKDTLTCASAALDAAEYIIQEMQDNFFGRYNKEKPEDINYILWEFNRNRAKMTILSTLIREISQAFKQNKIDCYLS